MTSTYYINYEIRRTNATFAWLSSPHFENEEDARTLYEVKMKKQNVVSANLVRCDHYESREMVHPERFPDGINDYRIIATYSRI